MDWMRMKKMVVYEVRNSYQNNKKNEVQHA